MRNPKALCIALLAAGLWMADQVRATLLQVEHQIPSIHTIAP
jgi:hypothetical protein